MSQQSYRNKIPECLKPDGVNNPFTQIHHSIGFHIILFHIKCPKNNPRNITESPIPDCTITSFILIPYYTELKIIQLTHYTNIY